MFVICIDKLPSGCSPEPDRAPKTQKEALEGYLAFPGIGVAQDAPKAVLEAPNAF